MIFTGEFLVNRVQQSESYRICYASVGGSLGALNCSNGNLDSTPFTITWTMATLSSESTAASCNVLVGLLAVDSPVPEPASL